MSETKPAKTMEDLVSLCKRRGFIYQASEIYGGLNGFWDYGPLGVQLKKNLADEWWRAMTLEPSVGPNGARVQIVGLDSAIVQNPKVWEASGHVGGFNDPMVDCRESKSRYRADHLKVVKLADSNDGQMYAYVEANPESYDHALRKLSKYVKRELSESDIEVGEFIALETPAIARVVGPDVKEAGTLTEPRMFNLMFETYVGAIRDEDAKAYLRPETAQGIFINYKNVLDTTRVKVPFGIAQMGKAFRNEVTPRNFVFRSREFEQMEMEWFCHPSEAKQWVDYWKERRMAWWRSIGLSESNLIFRDHDSDELSHYAKEGVGTVDIEYRWPFTDPGYGELEGISHRSNYDLTQHAKHSGAKLEYFDQEKNERYLPDVIEPAAGLTRGLLAILCEAYTPDPDRASGVVMKFNPKMAPIKAAVYPLVNKDGMPEKAGELHAALVKRFGRDGIIEYDPKQSIGKRYARMDEAGCPYCFTIDGQTLDDQTVTVRDRDTATQERIGIDRVVEFLSEKLN